MRKSMKIFLIMLLAITPLLGLKPISAQAAYVFSGGGSGVAGAPYIILTAKDLDHVRDDMTASYKLQSDIDLKSFGDWQPIGSSHSDSFKGNFDGAGYIISGMTIDSSAEYVGMFGIVGLATISNVRLETVDITSTSNAQVGGLAGLVSNSGINRSSVTGEINSVHGAIGGLIGNFNQNTISNSEAHVRLHVVGSAEVGGLVGSVSGGAIIDQSYATGDVTSNQGNIGGLVGALHGTIRNSYSTGNVKSIVHGSIGGLVGYVNGGIIENSYAKGIMSSDTGNVGGLVGRKGMMSIPVITSSYWNLGDNLTLQTLGWEQGTDGAVLQDAMKRAATYAGWDWSIWGIQEGVSYPYLKSLAPTLSVDPLSSSYSTNTVGNNQLTISGNVSDSSIGEPLEVSYTIKDASNGTVAGDMYAIAATGVDQAFSWSPLLDANRYPDGEYTANITVKDTVKGHEQLQTFTFVVDSIAPVITLNGMNPMPVLVSSNFDNPGVTALDAVAGDLTAKITVSGAVNTSQVGTYSLTYQVSDAAGNIATATRTVKVVSGLHPRISFNGAQTMQVEFGSKFTDPGTRAVDAMGGDLTSQIITSGTVNTNKLGEYNLNYSVYYLGYGSSTTRVVNVIDTTGPVITLDGPNLLQLEVGSGFTDPGATAVDAVDGDLSDEITFGGTVDTNLVGTYTVTYDVSDKAGNAAATATRTVNVVAATTPPTSPPTSPPSISLSSNADLAQLNVFAGDQQLVLSPVFAPATTEYRVETTAETIDLEAIAAHYAAKVKLADKQISKKTSVPLQLGENKLAVTVQAEDGTVKTYQVIVTRVDNTPVKTCTFTDIDNHWAKANICEATSLGIVEGVGTDIFMPNRYVTRAEFAIMLMRTLQTEIDKEAPETSFTDKDSILAWAQSAVQTAVAEGILEGYLDGSLQPQRTVNRTELTIMVARAMEWDVTDATVNTPFADDAAIPAWGKAYVEAVRKHELLQGRGENLFIPEGQTTRAEATVVLLRLWKSQEANK